MKTFRISLSFLILLLILSGVVFIPGNQEQVSSHGLEPENQTGRMSTEVVVERLVSFEGYSQVNSIELQGDTYVIRAMKNGREVNVQVDSLIGTIVDNSTKSVYLPLILKQ